MFNCENLEKICRKADTYSVDAGRIAERYEKTSSYSPFEALNTGQYEWDFKNLHAEICLEDAASELGISLRKAPKGMAKPNRNYNARWVDDRKLFVLPGRCHDISNFITRYDNVFEISGMPVIADYFLRSWNRACNRGSKKLRQAFDAEVVKKRLSYLKDMAHKDPGYIIFLPSDVYDKHASMRSKSPAVQDFRKKGGHIVRTNLTRSDFKREIEKALEEYNLPVR